MPMTSVTLRPGVDAQRTPTLNEAGVSQSQLIRYKAGLLQTYGGWQNYFAGTIPSTIRELHAWQGLINDKHLGIGATANLQVITAGSASDITPQTRISNPTPNFSISSGSAIVTIQDVGSSQSTYNTVYLNTPIAIGNLLLNGAYKIASVLGTSAYTIVSSVAASTTITSSGILPNFACSSGSQSITVTLPNNNFQSIPGLFQQFIATTNLSTAGSSAPFNVQGPYQIITVIDSTNFTINNLTQAPTTASSVPMNGGNAQLLYYVTNGAPPQGTGFGVGNYGAGGFGGVGAGQAGAPGTPITTTDWTLDNWGEVLLACPKNGPIYVWAPDLGFQNAQVITQAPFFNGGMFVSMPQQILVAWASVESSGVQDPLVVRWSNQLDYTNWTVSNQTTAGSFHFPTGSQIIGGMQCPTFGLISTDIDVWLQQYVGGTVIFNHTRVGSGCGWIGPHAAGVLGGIVYWCGTNNFFMLGPNGVVPMPCTVWDIIFQNINVANQTKVRCAPNSTFNEITWFYPSTNATENDSYVKVHIEGNEYEWDYGTLNRTAWVDISILGTPIGSDSSGAIYQHEQGNAITGAGLPSFQTGYWSITDGQDLAFVDFIMPDFIWGTRSGPPTAQVNITFFVTNYPGDLPTTFGPYTVTQATEYINTRMRGRLMAMLVQSMGSSEFWRLGKIRYRVAMSGRR